MRRADCSDWGIVDMTARRRIDVNDPKLTYLVLELPRGFCAVLSPPRKVLDPSAISALASIDLSCWLCDPPAGWTNLPINRRVQLALPAYGARLCRLSARTAPPSMMPDSFWRLPTAAQTFGTNGGLDTRAKNKLTSGWILRRSISSQSQTSPASTSVMGQFLWRVLSSSGCQFLWRDLRS